MSISLYKKKHLRILSHIADKGSNHKEVSALFKIIPSLGRGDLVKGKKANSRSSGSWRNFKNHKIGRYINSSATAKGTMMKESTLHHLNSRGHSSKWDTQQPNSSHLNRYSQTRKTRHFKMNRRQRRLHKAIIRRNILAHKTSPQITITKRRKHNTQLKLNILKIVPTT